MQRRSQSWGFSAGAANYGIRVDVDPEAPGGGTISSYTVGLGPFAEAGTSVTLADLATQGLPGPSIPPAVWAEVNAFIEGKLLSPQPAEASQVPTPDGEIAKRISWEEGYNWEFYYTIDIYRNGILFKAGGEAERGITEETEFQVFERPGGIAYPSFMSKGGLYSDFEKWLIEWNELCKSTMSP